MSKTGTAWSRDKINQLIELYRKHECLWNHWHESYKNKDKRNRAIDEICSTLRISKFDFGKKIHNLRNQFNTEMKKWEQRMVEAGGGETAGVDEKGTTIRCKWVHFESLLFLRNVIEPRPGGYQSSSYHPHKKMRLKFDYNSSEDDVNITMISAPNTNCNDDISSNYQYEDQNEDAPTAEDYQQFENEINEVVGGQSTVREDTIDQKYIPNSIQQQICIAKPVQNQKKISQNCSKNSIHVPPSSYAEIVNLSHHDNTSSTVEINANDVANNNATLISSSNTLTTTVPSLASTSVSNTPAIGSIICSSSNTNTSLSHHITARDQWDSFGELVATEFRNLNSDLSRKKLKRKIMQAMLEVGEEDDDL
ncbi:uncharacterized protein LOC142240930 [Haematobia irritans]|uniref:uncharacterized protein LOC142240930 n=1 Tax=Haematobia irritans TaxID=7368 RepID=UPI003F5065B0